MSQTSSRYSLKPFLDTPTQSHGLCGMPASLYSESHVGVPSSQSRDYLPINCAASSSLL